MKLGEHLPKAVCTPDSSAKDADQFRIVFSVEAIALLLIKTTKLVIVGDVAVVDGGQIGDAVRPKRLRMTQIHPALRGESRVADAMPAGPLAYFIGCFQFLWRTDLLHEIETMPQANYFSAGQSELNLVFEGRNIGCLRQQCVINTVAVMPVNGNTQFSERLDEGFRI